MSEVTMYLPMVYAQYEAGPPAPRPVQPTAQRAMQALDEERKNVGKPPLNWSEEFHGWTARSRESHTDLVYDVFPVQVVLP